MSDQKIENLLNLAAGSTNSEKEKSENLGVGFDPQTDTWEIIVKYTGDILALESRYPGIRIVPLLGQYAIATIRQNQLEDFQMRKQLPTLKNPNSWFLLFLWEEAFPVSTLCRHRRCS